MVADYPRGANIATSGLVGGPCLIKDTRQLSHFFGNNFMFANTALAINNSLPKVLIEEISRDHRLERITVGILGLSFKPNLDDVRSSLSIELYELLRLYAKEVLVTDPHVVNFPNNLSTDYVLRNSDLIIIATEHEEFLTIDFSGPVYKFY
jgi:UDP-N-acetyl-D-mannosaminuronic acid dehydrogenase